MILIKKRTILDFMWLNMKLHFIGRACKFKKTVLDKNGASNKLGLFFNFQYTGKWMTFTLLSKGHKNSLQMLLHLENNQSSIYMCLIQGTQVATLRMMVLLKSTTSTVNLRLTSNTILFTELFTCDIPFKQSDHKGFKT